jgi:hypothetical protein
MNHKPTKQTEEMKNTKEDLEISKGTDSEFIILGRNTVIREILALIREKKKAL